MDKKSIKKIVLKTEAVSNLNDHHMNLLWGARNVSAQTLIGCDSWNQCCTMFDCNTNGCNSDTCASFFPASCGGGCGTGTCACPTGTCYTNCYCGADGGVYDPSKQYGYC